jgi:Domain of unknown function (DUF1707)/Cell wall-active antibiotics response 4TMS YvqF
MRGDEHPKHAALRSLRAQTIEQLTNAFTRDELGLDEFEERLNQTYAAQAPTELAALVADLSAESAVFETELVAAPSTGLATVERPAQGQRAVAILGSVERRGHWTVARTSSALAVLGSVVIDLRDVAMPPGVTTLHVSAVLGSIEILVPPNLAVESEGSGILGSFEGVQRVPRDPDPDLPVLRVQGRAVLGSIEVVTRPDDARMARGRIAR